MVPPEGTTSCAACHVEAGQGRGWVFGAHRFFAQQVVEESEEEPSGMVAGEPSEMGENQINIVDYGLQPVTLTVKVGTEVTWVNNDVIIYTVTASDLSFNSGHCGLMAALATPLTHRVNITFSARSIRPRKARSL